MGRKKNQPYISMILFKGTIYPDKSFSFGAVPHNAAKKADLEYERECQGQYDSYYEYGRTYRGVSKQQVDFISRPYEKTIQEDYIDKHYRSLSTNVLVGMHEEIVPLYSVSVPCLDKIICDRPLFTSAPKSSQKKRGTYGKHGITSFGRRVCKNSALLLERKYGRKRLGFGTCTLPGMGKEVLSTIISNWGDIVRRFYQKIRRLYKKRDAEFNYVGCTEIQESRFERTGLAVPHLHFVYVAKANLHNGYTCDTREFYEAWNASVNEVLVLRGQAPVMGIDGHKGSVEVKGVRTSAGNYIGKYISKGCKVVQAMIEAGFEQFPKQWWNASMQCKKMFKSSLISMTSELCSSIMYGLDAYMEAEMIIWANFVTVPVGDELRTTGVVGRMSQRMYALVLNA